MEWTRTMPTEAGYYWVRCPPGASGWVSMAIVSYRRSPTTGELVNELGLTASPDNEFWGPITVPEGGRFSEAGK